MSDWIEKDGHKYYAEAYVAGILETAKRRGERAETAERELQTARAQVAALGEQLEHDRTLVASCLTEANTAVDSRHWLTEGRGPYEWNDDNWHGEFRAAAVEIKASLEPMTKVASSWKGCPTDATEIANARIDLKRKVAALEAVVKAARKWTDGLTADLPLMDAVEDYTRKVAALQPAAPPLSPMPSENCTCGHHIDEYGGDPQHPGSSACMVENCDCVCWEEGDDAE